MNLLYYLALFICVLLGGLPVLYGRRVEGRWLHYALSFSGAYILSITVLHLMPMVFGFRQMETGLYVLLGFLIQLLLEQFSGGVEHGHMHTHEHNHRGFFLTLLLGLSLHAFIEGLPLASWTELHHHLPEHRDSTPLWFLVGLILHKAPAAFALMIVFRESGLKRNTSLAALLFFALMSPLGVAAGQWVALKSDWQMPVLAIVVGSFLHISTTILFETDSGGHQLSLKKIMAILLGLGMGMLSLGAH
ncbi:MAG TPA: zinc/iron permease [Phaeodactylibacter sp.]|nr:zinc/iron permease [Phaeodactylibacter sp.]